MALVIYHIDVIVSIYIPYRYKSVETVLAYHRDNENTTQFGGFMARKKTEYTCTVTFTEGWQERLTQGFVDLYYNRLKRGEPVTEEQAQEQIKGKAVSI